MIWMRDGLATAGLITFIFWSFAAAQIAVAALS
jgi:hypothetical protein